ncbi:PREDICTED: uncharacterized protein LOC109193907 [Ipomoea nil]|uniref:uncharacterized protein LOC109193907 n=1 Tax=Ipomoea nil TaxID=35883 RepID=UPI0009011D5E|nr:PREDICTED: uncharacterized protein LOC109193907 [Ipomoea nil]
MVSEPSRPGSYVAAGTGEASQGGQAPPITQSPAQMTSTTILQAHRNYSTEDPENHLLFSTNDNPSLILVSPPLIGSSNYSSWCISMRIALEVKNKWCIIDGSLTEPSRESRQYAPWRRCNLMVCSWLFKSVHSSIAQSVMHLEKATDVWDDLR